MKQNDNTTPEQGHSANMLLYAVAPTPKQSTDAIALDGAVASRGNGIGAIKMIMFHIRSAVRYHQVLQVQSRQKKTLLIHYFILMNNTGLWQLGYSLMMIYPLIDILIAKGYIKKVNDELYLTD